MLPSIPESRKQRDSARFCKWYFAEPVTIDEKSDRSDCLPENQTTLVNPAARATMQPPVFFQMTFPSFPYFTISVFFWLSMAAPLAVPVPHDLGSLILGRLSFSFASLHRWSSVKYEKKIFFFKRCFNHFFFGADNIRLFSISSHAASSMQDAWDTCGSSAFFSIHIQSLADFYSAGALDTNQMNWGFAIFFFIYL